MSRSRVRLRRRRAAPLVVCLLFVAGVAPGPAAAGSIVDEWKKGLTGARLTSYSGSVISSNSTLTTIRFCSDGRYHYAREGSWSAGDAAAGASQSSIRGRWQVEQRGPQVVLTYVTDAGESGAFPLFLQADGKVNIGGAAYAVESGRAGC